MTTRFTAGWRQVGACLVLQVVGAAMLVPAFGVVAVSLGKEFHPSRMVLMLAVTLMALMSAIMSPFIGSLMDRTSMRRLMGLGTGFIVAGYLALSFATSFVQVLLVYALLMAPASVLVGPMAASVLISRWFIARRGAALGIAMSGVALGAFLFPPLVQWLIDSFAWRSGIRLLALIILLLAFPAAAVIVDQPADRGLYPDGAQTDPGISSASGSGPALTTRAILTDSTFWFAAAVFVVVISGMTGLITNLVPLATDQGIRPDRAALLLSINAAFAFCAKLIFAAVSDRLSLRTLMIISLTGFGVGMACLVRADAGFWLIAIGVGFVGLFGSFMSPLQPLLVSRTYGPWAMGRVAGLMNLVVLCVLLASPPIFGLMFDLTSDYDAIFLVYAVLGIATILVVPQIRLRPRSSDVASVEEIGLLGKDASPPLENRPVLVSDGA